MFSKALACSFFSVVLKNKSVVMSLDCVTDIGMLGSTDAMRWGHSKFLALSEFCPSVVTRQLQRFSFWGHHNRIFGRYSRPSVIFFLERAKIAEHIHELNEVPWWCLAKKRLVYAFHYHPCNGYCDVSSIQFVPLTHNNAIFERTPWLHH